MAGVDATTETRRFSDRSSRSCPTLPSQSRATCRGGPSASSGPPPAFPSPSSRRCSSPRPMQAPLEVVETQLRPIAARGRGAAAPGRRERAIDGDEDGTGHQRLSRAGGRAPPDQRVARARRRRRAHRPDRRRRARPAGRRRRHDFTSRCCGSRDQRARRSSSSATSSRTRPRVSSPTRRRRPRADHQRRQPIGAPRRSHACSASGNVTLLLPGFRPSGTA